MFELISKLFGKKEQKPDLPPHSGHHNARKREFELNPTKGQIMFVGDSITEAWNQPEHKKYLPFPVVNRGIAGDTTYGIIDVLPLLVAESPRKVFIKLGTNNLGWNTAACVNRIIPDLLNMVSAFKTIPKCQVYLQTILPVNPGILNRLMPGVIGGRTLENITKVNRLIMYFRNLGVNVIDTWSNFAQINGQMPKALTTDGLHLSEEGYRLWAEILSPYLD